ncbi:hypothetical protein LB503_005424 [Fusarium chuoi]|nr:hypothetical protein LB503_005424 [Fusarium chuoi]
MNMVAPTDGRENDELQRWKGVPIISWGVGGTVVTSFPKSVPRYGMNQAVPMIVRTPGEVKVQSVKDIEPLHEHVAKFPGASQRRKRPSDGSVLELSYSKKIFLMSLFTPNSLSRRRELWSDYSYGRLCLSSLRTMEYWKVTLLWRQLSEMSSRLVKIHRPQVMRFSLPLLVLIQEFPRLPQCKPMVWMSHPWIRFVTIS